MPDPVDPPYVETFDPNDPKSAFYVAPGTPVWNEADIAPMPEGSVANACPYCNTVLLSAGKHPQPGDPAVCSYCLNLAIREENGTWRTAYFDEAEMWDQDPRIKAMRAIWTNLPVEETPPTEEPTGEE